MGVSWNKSTWEWYGKRLFKAVVGAAVRSKSIPPGAICWEKVRRVLVIRQHDPLGDVLLTTAAFRALKKGAPQAEIDLIVKPDVATLFEDHPDFDRVILFNKYRMRWSLGYTLGFFQELRETPYDVAIVFNGSSFSATSAWLAYLSRAPIRIGYSGDSFGYEGFGSSFYTTEIAVPSGPLHETKKHLHLLAAVGIPHAGDHHGIHVSNHSIDQVKEMLREKKVDVARPLICLHPGSGKPDHRWPVEHFARLNDELAAMKNAQVVMVVGPNEGDLEASFLSVVSQAPVMLPRLSLKQLASLFQLSRVVVCNDTGVMHVAAGTGTPTVSIFGPYDPAYWNPIGSQHIALRARDRKYESVSVSSVLEAVMGVLSSRRHS